MLSRRRVLLYRVRLRTVCRCVVAAEVIALRRLIPLLRCRITLGVTRTQCCWAGVAATRMRTLLQLRHRRLTLAVAGRLHVLGGAQPANRFGLMRSNDARRLMRGAQAPGDVGWVELLGHTVVRVRRVAAIRRVMLPAHRLAADILPAYLVEVININIDVIAIMLIAAVIIMIVMVIVMMVIVVMMMVVIIPIDITENSVSSGNPKAVAETSHKAVGKLFPRRGRQIDRRRGGIRPAAAVNHRRIVVRYVHHLRIARLNLDNRWRAAGGMR